MGKKLVHKWLPTAFFGILLFLRASAAYAITTPSFPVCTNPQGSLKVSYSTGTHGVVGDPTNYKGSDAVYTLSGETLVQCLCVEDGRGIQTNWWKVSGLTDSNIESLKSQGWFYIPNGSLWGLENAPYVAINSVYSCGGGIGGVGGPEVLGLAGTGDSVRLYSVGLLAFVFLVVGLKKNTHGA